MSLIIALGVLFFYHLYITDKLNAVRYEIDTLKKLLAAKGASVAVPSDERAQIETHTVTTDSYQAPASFIPSSQQRTNVPTDEQRAMYAPSEPSAFELWLKQDVLVKVGALLLLIAFGWFVSYAFANNWIGPFGRITLGIVAGLGIMILGIVRIQKSAHQGAIFTVLGSTIIILTLFAARGIYDFFTPASALGLMFMTVAFVAFVSIRYKREQLAVASLLLGAVAPLLTNAPAPDITGLSLYLLMLVLGTLWVVYLNHSAVLTPLALGIVALYGLPFLGAPLSEESLIALFFAFVFVAIFFVTNVLSILANRNQNPAGDQAHYVTAIGTGLYLFLWIAAKSPETWLTPLYLVWMLTFVVGAFAVYVRTNNRLPFYIYGSVALGLLGAATANEFNGPVLTIVYTIELLTMVLVADYLVMNSKVASKLAWLFAPLSLFALQHVISPAWQDGIIHGDFFATIIVTLALLIVGVRFHQSRTADDNAQTITSALLLIGGFYVLILIWLVFHAVLADGPATTFSLITYTLGGLLFYITGRHENNKNMTTIGMLLIGGVVVRLLVIDVWALPLELRIVLFFIIGVLLLSTAFIKKGTKKSI
jgi:hypothetical protein